MSILTSIFQKTIGRILPTTSRSPPTKNKVKTRDMDEKVPETASSHKRRKREDSNDFEERFEIITKRLRVDEDRYAPIVNGEVFESAEMEGPFAGPMDVKSGYHNARALMPPPLLSPLNSGLDESAKDEDMSEDSTDIDDISHLSQYQKPLSEFSSEYSMEQARRHALATTLPPKSGIWESSERDLFYHLSYRGFEPLFPENWMQDFETLPLSLYATATTAEPLIQNHQTKEFRALRELRDLMNLGKNVRDKVLATPGSQWERTIERATEKYISWALTDVGVKLHSSNKSTPISSRNKTMLPIHVLVKLKNHQTTRDALLELKYKLHTLASKHRQARNIHISIEETYEGCHTPAATEDETQVVESSDDDLPVLYGILIFRSILTVFTMNSQTPLPKGWHTTGPYRNNTHRPSPAVTESIFDGAGVRTSDPPVLSRHDTAAHGYPAEGVVPTRDPDTAMDGEDNPIVDDSPSDPRFISTFDFSDSTRDVWNALVIAILAMQIRKDMLVLKRNYDKRSDPLDEVTAGIEDASVIDEMEDDDPDL